VSRFVKEMNNAHRRASIDTRFTLAQGKTIRRWNERFFSFLVQLIITINERREEGAFFFLSLLFPFLTHSLFIGRATSELKREKKAKEKKLRCSILFHCCSHTLQMISHREVEYQSQTYGQRTGRVATVDALLSPSRDYCHGNPIG
jgi:hypothetical protein